jgi:hypothetical protein
MDMFALIKQSKNVINRTQDSYNRRGVHYIKVSINTGSMSILMTTKQVLGILLDTVMIRPANALKHNKNFCSPTVPLACYTKTATQNTISKGLFPCNGPFLTLGLLLSFVKFFLGLFFGFIFLFSNPFFFL